MCENSKHGFLNDFTMEVTILKGKFVSLLNKINHRAK